MTLILGVPVLMHYHLEGVLASGSTVFILICMPPYYISSTPSVSAVDSLKPTMDLLFLFFFYVLTTLQFNIYNQSSSFIC